MRVAGVFGDVETFFWSFLALSFDVLLGCVWRVSGVWGLSGVFFLKVASNF